MSFLSKNLNKLY